MDGVGDGRVLTGILLRQLRWVCRYVSDRFGECPLLRLRGVELRGRGEGFVKGRKMEAVLFGPAA